MEVIRPDKRLRKIILNSKEVNSNRIVFAPSNQTYIKLVVTQDSIRYGEEQPSRKFNDGNLMEMK